jgi:hypothetical protein
VVEYEVAEFSVEHSDAVHELPHEQVESTILRVVEIEGPVHTDEVARRVASLYGLKRMSSRLNETVQARIEQLVADGKLDVEEEFVAVPDGDVQVRDRSKVTHLRKTDLISLAEIRAGVKAIVDAHFGATREDAIIETGRLFGFSATSSQLRERIDSQVAVMLTEGELVEMDGWLHLSSACHSFD